MTGDAVLPDTPSIRQHTVLVVDDEEMLRLVVCRELREAGFVVLEAGNGSEALRLVQQDAEPIDVVVTDVMMPGMDGHELGRQLARHQPALPVVYMSAYELGDVFHRDAPNHAERFLRKPFPVRTLVATLRELSARVEPRSPGST